MIRTFTEKETQKIFRRQFSRKFQGIAAVAKRKVDQVHAAASLSDLRAIPGCFIWKEPDAFDVGIVDYH